MPPKIYPIFASIPDLQPAFQPDMKQTPLTDRHIALGAKMTDFAGFLMPVSYTGINEEHLAVRHAAGIFDVSHMGEFILKGEHALDLIQQLTTNDASRLFGGMAQYSCMTNEQGGIIDDLLVYCLEKNKAYLLVVNAGNIDKDWNWINFHNTSQVELHNISAKTCLLAIQGPLAIRVLQSLTPVDLPSLKYYTFVRGQLAGVDNVLISATGYTGAGGVEIYFEDKEGNAAKIWDSILEAGVPFGLKPAGLGARDTLRLEMGFCLYGNDIDDLTTPLEAGLGWITKFTKPFTASPILCSLKERGVKQKLVGFEVLARGIPRKGYPLTDPAGNPAGRVTSGTQSPVLQRAIGLGYVNAELAVPGTELFVGIRDRKMEARVVKIPFVR